MSIHRVIYISKSRRTFSQNELMGMCAQFAATNATLEVTGILIRLGDWFVQVIEGETDVVRNLYASIQEDHRHGAVSTISEQPDNTRLFGQWSMNLLDLDARYYVNLASVADLREQVEDMLNYAPDKKKVMQSLLLNVIEFVRATAPRGEPVC